MKTEIYKIYQLLSFFINKFSYQSFVIKDLKRDNEIWLINKTNPKYQLIRITNDPLEKQIFDKDRIEEYIGFFKKNSLLFKINFLDIHISNEKVYENELYDSVCINSDYYDGVDVTSTYPGINTVVHDVANEKEEITNIVNAIKSSVKATSKANLNAKLIIKNPYIVTYTVIFICIINYILCYFLSNKYSQSSSLIFLGANYTTFTLGLGQFWRLFTSAFSHVSLMHLAMNMIGLYNIGTLVEYHYGHIKTLLLLSFGIVVGSLTAGILTTNSIIAGMSGGIYSLFTFYLMVMFKKGTAWNGPLLFTLMINIGLNFMSNVSWQAHLGGAIVGVIFYFYNENGFKHFIILTCLLVFALGLKYNNKDKIYPLYSGTDYEVLDIYRDFGLNSTANSLKSKLEILYIKNGKLK